MKVGPLPFATNAADYQPPDFEVVDEDTEEAFLLTDVDDITIRVRGQLTRVTEFTHNFASGNVSLVDFDFKFRWTVPAAQMRRLDPGPYDVSAIIEQDGDFRQAFLGSLTVLDGVGP